MDFDAHFYSVLERGNCARVFYYLVKKKYIYIYHWPTYIVCKLT